MALETLATLTRKDLGVPFTDWRTLLAFEAYQRQVAVVIPDQFNALSNLQFVVTALDTTVSPNAKLITAGANITVTSTPGAVTIKAVPSGSTGQIQYNNAGAFAGGNLSGDVTTSGSLVTTLATVNANVGSFGDSTHVATFTVNAKGLTTAAASVAIPTFTSSTVGFVPASGGGTTNYLRADGTFAAPPGTSTGTVTSVGLVAPAIFTVSGSPVTTTGTLTVTLATQAANLVWAGPTTGAAAAPTFRALVSADMPTSTYYGAGVPSTLHSEGDRYYDTTTIPYQAYVQHSGAWRLSGAFADVLDIRGYGAVSGSSGAAAAFAAAVAAVPTNGGTIYIPDGNWVWEAGETISRNDVTVIASPGAIAILNANAPFITLAGQRNTIRGGQWNGNSTNPGAGLWITGQHNLIEDAYVYGVAGHGIGLDGQATTCQYNTVRRNYVTGPTGIGISQNKSLDAVINGNVVIGSGLEGITIDNASHRSTVQGNSIINTCLTAGVGGIGVDGSNYFRIVGNHIDTTTGSLAGIKTQNNTGSSNYGVIDGNTITACTKGVWLFNGSGGATTYCVVSGNALNSNAGTAIQVDASCINNQIGTNSYGGDAIVNASQYTAAPGWLLLQEQSPSSTGTVTFSAIPATYRDLMIVVRGAGTKTAAFVEVRFQLNADTGANYDYQAILFNNATSNSAGSPANTYIFGGWLPAATGVASSSSAVEAVIYNYRDTTAHKTVMTRGGLRTGTTAATLFATDNWADWRNTGAVTSITAFLDANNFVSTTSVVSLYARL